MYCDGFADLTEQKMKQTKNVMYYENFDMETIVTPVNIPVYKKLLEQAEYDTKKTEELIEGFTNGFSIGYRGPDKVRKTAPNLKFRIGDEIDLWNKVMKEVKAKRYAGPFADPPFDYFIQSPIGLVPKDNGNDTRLIFHLSYPRNDKKESVNSNTPPELCRVVYPDFSEAIQKCLEEGHYCYISRSDMRAAFRNLGICKMDWKYLCMRAKSPLDGKWYYFFDKALPFGSSISCKLFQDFSDSVAYLVQWKLKLKKKITNYLDDFLFIALLKALCDKQVETFLQICSSINFPVSMEKTFWSNTRMTFLGFLIDTIKQIVCIPIEKVTKGINMITFTLSRKKLTVLQLQKICGFLNFLGRCIVPGRAFTRRLYSHLENNMLKQHHHVRISNEMRLDLNMWLQFLKHPTIYARPFMDFSNLIYATELNFYSDASRNPILGFGARFGRAYMYSQWDYDFMMKNNPSITYLELYAVVAAVLAWGHEFANKRVIIYCDNKGSCAILNNLSSKCKNCMVLVRIVVMFQMIHNIRIYANYVKTELNGPADSLSRLKISKFKRLVGSNIDEEPTNIPEDIWPMSKIWI